MQMPHCRVSVILVHQAVLRLDFPSRVPQSLYNPRSSQNCYRIHGIDGFVLVIQLMREFEVGFEPPNVVGSEKLSH